jgi:hypothetical protein
LEVSHIGAFPTTSEIIALLSLIQIKLSLVRENEEKIRL